MGCTGSVVHPSIYNETTGKTNKANGTTEKRKLIEEDANHIRGDYSQYQYAKHTRGQNQKAHQMKLFSKADEMSVRIMEERELLSLGTRSRGTSRATSRTTSPNSNKRNVAVKDELLPMTPVVEDKLSRGESYRSDSSSRVHTQRDIDVHVVNTSLDIPQTNPNVGSLQAHPKAKKHKTRKPAKTKGKQQKHKKGKKSTKTKSKHDDTVLLNNGDSDSGLEDDVIDIGNTGSESEDDVEPDMKLRDNSGNKDNDKVPNSDKLQTNCDIYKGDNSEDDNDSGSCHTSHTNEHTGTH